MIREGHNPFLDGLRGVAIIMVICYHYFSGFYLFDFGWMGVDLFFVLSGYLLSGRLYPYLDIKKIILKFYLNRFLRIVPVAFLFLTLYYLANYLFASPETLRTLSIYFNNKAAIYFFLTNWVLIVNSPEFTGPLEHLWSLAVEEQFYIFFPLFIIIFKTKKSLLYAGIGLILSIFIIRLGYFLQRAPSPELDKQIY